MNKSYTFTADRLAAHRAIKRTDRIGQLFLGLVAAGSLLTLIVLILTRAALILN